MSGELDEYEKVLEEDRNAESGSFSALQYPNISPKVFHAEGASEMAILQLGIEIL